MKKVHKSSLTVLLSAMFGASLCLPVSYADEITAGDVYVTATRIEKELQDVPMSVSVMTEEDIKKSGARTVGELLEDVPGVQIQNSGSQGLKRIQIRGEDPFRTLVLIDGQKISEHKSMDGSPILIDASRIERVEVIKGPASVLYGSDAIGGVINIITKKGGEKPLQGEVYAAYNGASRGFSEGLALYGANKGWNYRLSGSYSDQGNIHTPVGEFDNTGFRQKDFSGFLSYDFNENFTLGGGIDYYKGSFNSTSMDYALDPDTNFFVHIPLWDRNKYSVFAELKDISEYLVRLRADAYYQRTEKEMQNYLSGVMGAGSVMNNLADNIVYSKGVSVQSDWQLGDSNYLIAGYELMYDKLDSDGSTDMFMSAMGGMMEINTLTTKYYDGTQLNQSVFASMETLLPYDFALTYGVRWTHVKTELTRGDEYMFGYMTTPFGGGTINYDGSRSGGTDLGSDTNSRPVFNVGLVWTGIDNLALRASWAQGFRVATLSEKYIESSMGGGTLFGNPDLDPETSDNFEIGARWFDGKNSADLTFFYSKAENYIASLLIDASTEAYRYSNVAKAVSFGSELSLSRIFETKFGKFTPYTTFTYLRRKYDDGNGFATYNTATPELFARYGLRYEKAVHEKVDFNADVYLRSQSETEYSSADGSSDYRIGGFTTVNLAAGLDFGSEKQYNVTAEVLNIFDKRYQYTTALYEPGVHFNLKLSMAF